MTRESDLTTDRRSLLRLGSATVAAAVAGCQWRSDHPEEDPGFPNVTPDGEAEGQATAGDEATEKGEIPYSDRYETVVDVVEDADADPEAGKSINPLLERESGDDTLLYFPPGRYLMDTIWKYESFTNLGVVGEDATIVPKEGYNDYLFVMGVTESGGTGLHFEGFEFDFRAPGTHPRPVQGRVTDGLIVRDVVARGSSGTARFDVTTEDGSGVVRNLRLPGGGMEPNPVGILVGPENVGEIRFVDCVVQGFPGNGLYASPSNGPIRVEGGFYANSGVSNVRVSGPAEVRNVHVRCDRAPDGFRNMRGIRLRHGDSVLVENCTVEMRDVTYSEGALVIEPRMGTATVRNLDIEVSADEVMAINAKSIDPETKPAVEFEDVSITGSAGNGPTIRIVDRDDCTFERLDVRQTGRNRDGFHLIRSDGTVLDAASIDVTGEPFVLDTSEVEKRDVTIVGEDSEATDGDSADRGGE